MYWKRGIAFNLSGVFYVYDSKIHFIYAIPFIFWFLVILSWWVCLSLSTMVFFHRQRCWLLFFELFLGFLVAHECDHSLELLLTYELLFWAIILSPYNPPLKPDSGLVLCSGDDAVDGDWSCSDTAPLSPLLAASGHPSKFVLDHYTTVPRW